MENLTFIEKIELLCTAFGEGAKFVSVVMRNDVQSQYSAKADIHPKFIFKIGTYQMTANFNYVNSVINQQKREGNDAPEFEAKESKYKHIHKWFATLKSDPTKHYFYAKMDSVKYDEKLYYIKDDENRPLTEQEFLDLQPFKKTVKSKETTQSSQNIEKIVEPRHFKFENIRKIKCGIEIQF
jgi:hypothetical protein